jgi:HD domain-containing protein
MTTTRVPAEPGERTAEDGRRRLDRETSLTGGTTRLGSVAWSDRTRGNLSGAERRRLLAPLARAHAVNAVGRTAMALRLHSGRRAQVPEGALRTPPSALTRTAEQVARQRLTPALLNHSYRCYSYGVAIAALEDVDVDRELLFAAAMLHDTGLSAPVPGVDFTLASARIALEVAGTIGLSAVATETLRTAITMHHSPGVTLAEGAEAYLLSAASAVDVIGLGRWKLPDPVVAAVLAERPRLGFTKEFRDRWAAEAAAVPQGRARFLRRYGAFDLAIRLAPYSD